MSTLLDSHREALFQDAVKASSALAAAVRPSFGPGGLDVIVEDAEGHVSCCNCGRLILASLSLSHPIGTLISQSVTNYHRNAGDGSKKMLMILSGIMKELAASPRDPLSKIEVSRALLWLNQSVVPRLFDQLREKKLICQTAKGSDDLKQMLLNIASTSYQHLYGRAISTKLGEILTGLILPSSTNMTLLSIARHIEFTRKNMSCLLVPQPGYSVTRSRTIPGLLLDADLIHPSMIQLATRHKTQCYHKRAGSNEVWVCRALLVVEWSVSLGEEFENCPQLSVRQLGVGQVADSLSRLSREKVALLKNTSIQLLLCCGKLPALARQALRDSSILTVEMVPRDLFEVLAECCLVHPLPNIFEMRDTSSITASSLSLSPSLLTLDTNKQFLCLEIPPEVKIRPVTLLLSAPTLSLCHQFQRQISNTLLLVGGACRGDEPLTALLGGGAWEMALIRDLEAFKERQKFAKFSLEWVVVDAFQKGLMTVPHSLLTSSQTSHTHSSLRTLYTSIFTAADDLPCLAVDCVNGTLTEVDDQWPILEPTSLQLHLLHSALALASQLVRLDLITAATRRDGN